MRWTIGKRIFTALTITSLVIVGLNAASARWSFQRGFVEYLGQQETERLSGVVDGLAEIYRRDASWEGLKNEHRLWDELFRDKIEHSRPPPRYSPMGDRKPPRRGGLPPNDPLDLRARVALLDANGAIVKGRDFLGEQTRRVEVSLDGELVGELLVLPQTELTEQVDVNFANEQTRSIIYTSILVLIFAALIAALIAKQLVRPISALTAGTRALTAGSFEKRITVARDDELGDLARDFNLLAETLQANQTSRRQWVSDIAHELRTPLAILSGELQAIEDGVRNFDEGTRSSLQAEVDRLGRLVADLHELTLSDEGGLRYDQETVDVAAIMKQTLDASQMRFDDAELSTQLDVGEEQLLVAGDSARLEQLFMNLIENSIRYTDSPGAIEVRINASDETVMIVFEDSLPGVSESEAHRLFDRLYRVDDSRNRTMGGSGLGLSICESIVGAHGGEITAGQSNLGGVAIQIKLPRVAASASKP
jgi:two-component system sensor histidine kinase BaeS